MNATDREAPSFGSQTRLLVAASGVTAVVSVAYLGCVGRFLPPSEYSAVAAGLSVCYLYSLVLYLLDSGITHLAATFTGSRDAAGLCALATDGSCYRSPFFLLLVVASTAVYELLAACLNLDAALALILVFYSACSVPLCVFRAVLRGTQRLLPLGINQVAESLFRLVGGALLLILWPTPESALLGYATGTALSSVLGWHQLRVLRTVEKRTLDYLGGWNRYTSLAGYQVFFWFGVNVDVLVARRFLPLAESGLYGAASTLARMLYVLGTPVYQLLLAHTALLHAQGKDPRRLVLRVVAWGAVLLTVSLVAPRFYGAEILTLLFGPPYARAASTLQILWLASGLLICVTLGAYYVLTVSSSPRGSLFLLPCLLMAVLFGCYHRTAAQIAIVSLMGAAAALAVVICGLRSVPGRASTPDT